MSGGVVANTTVSILRGEATDAWQDDIDPPAPVYTGVAVSLLEVFSNSSQRNESRPQTIRRYKARFIDPTTDLLEDDRLRDERTNSIYTVTQIDRRSNPFTGRYLGADLMRAT
jgi:hypothetical protein